MTFATEIKILFESLPKTLVLNRSDTTTLEIIQLYYDLNYIIIKPFESANYVVISVSYLRELI